MRKRWIWITVAVLVGVSVALVWDELKPSKMPKEAPVVTLLEDDSDLLRFVYAHLVDEQDGGIYTNFRNDYASEPNMARNHDKLSESTGLMMQYAINTSRHDIFIQQYHFLTKRLLHSSGLVRWVVSDEVGEQRGAVNASIDDLRLIRTLHDAAELWDEPTYVETANKIASALYEYNRDDQLLADSYEFDTQQRANQVTSSYLDVPTMRLLANIDPRWTVVADSSQELLVQAYMKETGLFRKTYLLDASEWEPLEKYNLIDILIPAIYLQEVGGDLSPTVDLLSKLWEKQGGLPSNVDGAGNALDQVESPAVYSLAIQLLEPQQHKLAVALRDRLTDLANWEHPDYRGGFIWTETMECYSFDQLTALLTE